MKIKCFKPYITHAIKQGEEPIAVTLKKNKNRSFIP